MARPDALAERYEEARLAFASSLGSAPERAAAGLGTQALLSSFEDRWTRMHRYALAGLAEPRGPGDFERDFEREANLLLKRRKALVSACAQALARLGQAARGEADGANGMLLKAIDAHDAIFGSIVQAELGRLKTELARARGATKALGAYARTMQYRGE